MKNTLIIGIGNSGRQDDGLGWQFLESIEDEIAEKADLEYRYQLQVEDAELISHYHRVIFVDADTAHHKKGFQFKKVKPAVARSYTSHRISPEEVLNLAQNLYHKRPECYMLGISGCSFNLEIGLTHAGQQNLEKALSGFQRKI